METYRREKSIAVMGCMLMVAEISCGTMVSTIGTTVLSDCSPAQFCVSQAGIGFDNGTPGRIALSVSLSANSADPRFDAVSLRPAMPDGVNAGEWLKSVFGLKIDSMVRPPECDRVGIDMHVQAATGVKNAASVTPEPAMVGILGIGSTIFWKKR